LTAHLLTLLQCKFGSPRKPASKLSIASEGGTDVSALKAGWGGPHSSDYPAAGLSLALLLSSRQFLCCGFLHFCCRAFVDTPAAPA